MKRLDSEHPLIRQLRSEIARNPNVPRNTPRDVEFTNAERFPYASGWLACRRITLLRPDGNVSAFAAIALTDCGPQPYSLNPDDQDRLMSLPCRITGRLHTPPPKPVVAVMDAELNEGLQLALDYADNFTGRCKAEREAAAALADEERRLRNQYKNDLDLAYSGFKGGKSVNDILTDFQAALRELADRQRKNLDKAIPRSKLQTTQKNLFTLYWRVVS